MDEPRNHVTAQVGDLVYAETAGQDGIVLGVVTSPSFWLPIGDNSAPCRWSIGTVPAADLGPGQAPGHAGGT